MKGSILYIFLLVTHFAWTQNYIERQQYIINLAKKSILNESFMTRVSIEQQMNNNEITFKIMASNNIKENIVFIKIAQRNLQVAENAIYYNCLNNSSGKVNKQNVYNFLIEKYSLDTFSIENYNMLLTKHIDKLLFKGYILPFQCDYLIAIDTLSNTIYKLKGFQVNETKRFVHHSLLLWGNYEKSYLINKIKNKKVFIKSVLKDISIEDFDIARLYQENKKNETNYCKSCYIHDYYDYILNSNSLRIKKNKNPCNIQYNYCD